MSKANKRISNASTDAFADIFGKLPVAPKQANAEATADDQRREGGGAGQQELLEAIGSCLEEVIDDQRYRFQHWLDEHKAEEALRYTFIEPQIRACVALLQAILDHVRNPSGDGLVATKKKRRSGAAS
ncbi:hypothetical protein [Ralstonia pickettii]|jgi:hypothetical protein|uniref:hypothetical protein n=1 Tax=Ralstonia pickettii TaxID=329 RepID=UPI0015FBAD12|nr:hypothetical protein [Ralstonia pickettii]MBB0025885.1 hypothetical protein [Ralstonia pickettii]MBB0036756.1 hypothetical protein [Ralstonia pickettii]MBB0099213.1 hypothetical protein [Ralstonia pickettii]MBB0109091.1 hypothetical protein [Ralstonia pickettii]MBB0130070.1 hypothetical protein [Ralstonia pickettii]